MPFELREGISLDPGRFYVLEDSWSTKGAQEFPLGVVVLAPETISDTLGPTDVVFVGGSPSNQIVGFVAW